MLILLWRIPLDFAAIVGAWFSAYFLRPYTDLIPGVQHYFPPENLPALDSFLIFSLFSAGAFFLLAAALGHYRFSETFEPMREGVKLAFAIFVWGMLIVAWYALFWHELIFSRVMLAHAMLFSLVLCFVARVLMRGIQILAWKLGNNRQKIILIGKPKYTGPIEQELMSDRQFQIVEIVQEENIYMLEKLKKEADELWRCDPHLSESSNRLLREICDEKHLLYRFVPRERALSYTHLELSLIADTPFLVARPSDPSLWQRVFKRGFDILFTVFILILLSPFLMIFALLIKLDSEGPIFFKSTRMGRNSKPFSMWKFRSMVIDAEKKKKKLIDMSHRDGPLFKVKNDPRITRFGRFLRRFSLDELPNFINVLRGEMSIVGPRPHLPEEVNEYEKWQKRVLSMKPGVTGLAQTSGRSDLPFEDEVRLDLYYMENWNLWLDLKIILKTVEVVLSQKGAD